MKQKHLWKKGAEFFFAPGGKRNIVIILTGLFAALNNMIKIILPGRIISALHPNPDCRKAVILIAAFCVSSLLVNYLSSVFSGMIGYTNLLVNESVREKLIKLQAHVKLLDTESSQYADQIAFAQKCIDRNFYMKASNLFVSLVSIVLVGIGCLNVIREKSVILPFIEIGAVLFPLLYYCKQKMNELSFGEVIQNNPVRREMEAVQWDMLDLKYGQEIRCFNLLNFMKEKYNESRNTVYRIRLNCCKKTAAWALIPALIYGSQLFYSYYASAQLLTRDQIDIGGFVAYASALFSMTMLLSNLVDSAVSVRAERQYLVSLLDCMSEYSVSEPDSRCELTEQNDAFHMIEFSHVYFSYYNDENYALKDLNIVIHAGDKISVVGENGSGKSTFIKMLLGLYTPTKGTILIDGTDLRDLSPLKVSRLFAPVFQDYATTAYSIGENVALQADPDENRLHKSLERAGIWGKVASLPNGAATYVFYRLDPDGTELSGGELQKLAMGRAYYKDAPVLVLDEPTAALSPQAEEELYQKVWHESGTKTVFFISHRLSSCCDSERILVFREGELAEAGNHKTLMEKHAYYYQLFQTQAEHYN